MKLLGRETTPLSVKESIIRDQRHLMKIARELDLGLTEPIKSDFIDQLIEFRKQIKTEYEEELGSMVSYGINIYQDFAYIFGFKLQKHQVSFVAFKDYGCAGSIAISLESKLHYPRFLRLPIIRMINNEVKSLDVILMHELIHIAESDEHQVGIRNHKEEEDVNNIANEVRTQKLAIKLTKELHEEGIFVFDNPKDYAIGGKSAYEWLFPLSYDFIDEHEKFISTCAITNNAKRLESKFGVNWNAYARYLSLLFDDLLEYRKRVTNKINVPLDNTHKDLIASMQLHSQNQGGINFVQ